MIILLGVILFVGVAGAITIYFQHQHISQLYAQREQDRTQTNITIAKMGADFAKALVASEGAYERLLKHRNEYLHRLLADLSRRVDDLYEIEAGIVTYLDDVPQNFAFHKADVRYSLKLPDRLRVSLGKSS